MRLGQSAPEYVAYHDNEWGQPLHGAGRAVRADEPGGLPERPVLADHPAQTGEFPRAFAGFDIDKVARFTDADVARLMADQGIVRNRAKIEATIANARAVAELDVDLSRAAVVVRPAAHRGPPPSPTSPPSARNPRRWPRN